MKKIEAILKCYGQKALKQDIKIIRKGIDYNTWMIEKIKTAKKLKKMYTKKQIITIYESGIWYFLEVEIFLISTFFRFSINFK